MTLQPGKVGPATLLFLSTEILCYFLFSVWWRVQVPLWLGIGFAFGHLLGLAVILWLWECWKPDVDLEQQQPIPAPAAPLTRWPILLVMVAGLMTQWAFFGVPVLSGPDEPVMIHDHARQVSSFLASGPMVVTGLILASIAILVVTLQLVRPAVAEEGMLRTLTSRWPWLALLVMVMIGYGLAEGASRINWGLAERWPPLGTVLLLPLKLATMDEIVSLRLISALFYCGTGYLVYRMVRAETSQLAALSAAILLMTSPAFFNWGHYAFREMGGVFFLTLGVFCLQRLTHWRRPEDFALVFAVAALGYLQRRPSALLALIAGITILWVFHWRLFSWKNLRALAMPALAMIWVVLPWLAISSNVRVYVLYIEHLTEKGTLLSYALALPGQAGWALVILSIAGLISGLLCRRKVTWIVLCWVLLLNFLFIMDVTAPRVIDRFAIHFMPGLAILSGLALGVLKGRKLAAAATLTAIAGVATLGTWFLDDKRAVPLLARDGLRYSAEPLLPFDQVASWLDAETRELADGERLNIYLPIPLQTSLPLYLSKHRNYRIRLHEANRRTFRPNKDLDIAFAACRTENCDYMVVPVHRQGHLILHPEYDLASLEARQPDGVVRFTADHGTVLLVPPPLE